MTTYVRCIKNQTLFADDSAEDFTPHLIIGRVYKVASPKANDGGALRIVDGSGEDYLYPAEYFEPFRQAAKQPKSSPCISTPTSKAFSTHNFLREQAGKHEHLAGRF